MTEQGDIVGNPAHRDVWSRSQTEKMKSGNDWNLKWCRFRFLRLWSQPF